MAIQISLQEWLKKPFLLSPLRSSIACLALLAGDASAVVLDHSDRNRSHFRAPQYTALNYMTPPSEDHASEKVLLDVRYRHLDKVSAYNPEFHPERMKGRQRLRRIVQATYNRTRRINKLAMI